MTSFCFTHIYTVHLKTICMVLICDSCKARISIGIISKHIGVLKENIIAIQRKMIMQNYF